MASDLNKRPPKFKEQVLHKSAGILDDHAVRKNIQTISGLNNIVPIGAILPWAKSLTGVPNLPDNFSECDGSVINDGASPMDGQTIPDLNRDHRFMRGNSTSGGTGGSSTHTLTENEMPAHVHSGITTLRMVSVSGGLGQAARITGATYTDSTGGDKAHENKPPYYDIVWIIRIK